MIKEEIKIIDTYFKGKTVETAWTTLTMILFAFGYEDVKQLLCSCKNYSDRVEGS